MPEEEFTTQETKAPFNMAINTLERLGNILSQIRSIGVSTELPESKKQALKVTLVRQFFIQSSPLLDEEIVKKYEKDFLCLRPRTAKVRIKEGNIIKNTNYEREVFDWELEVKLDRLLLAIQRELQKEKYFMPPKRDLSHAVGSFK